MAATVGDGDRLAADGNIPGIDDAVEPARQPSCIAQRRYSWPIECAAIEERALRGEMVRRGGHEDVIAGKCDRGTVMGMQSVALDAPGLAPVVAETQARSRKAMRIRRYRKPCRKSRWLPISGRPIPSIGPEAGHIPLELRI